MVHLFTSLGIRLPSFNTYKQTLMSEFCKILHLWCMWKLLQCLNFVPGACIGLMTFDTIYTSVESDFSLVSL